MLPSEINKANDEVEVFQDARGKYRWHRYDPNGNIVVESGQGYVSQSYATAAAEAYNPDITDIIQTPERR